jgi:multidrug efflux pump subunit AcrA (membrane-fusion protein)
MAHLLPQSAQEEIETAGDQAEEDVSERLSPVEMPPPPSGEGDLHHRLGYLEATLRSQEELLRQHRTISEQQASELARVQQQTEIQEAELLKKTAQVEEVEKEPGFFEKLFGGSQRRKQSPSQ